MRDTKFTPGPWMAEKPRWTAPTDERHVYDTHGQLIARIPLAGRFQSVNETVVNTHLIAAAPEVYHELEDSVRLMCNNCNQCELDANGKPMFASQACETYTRKVAALRKARGE